MAPPCPGQQKQIREQKSPLTSLHWDNSPPHTLLGLYQRRTIRRPGIHFCWLVTPCPHCCSVCGGHVGSRPKALPPLPAKEALVEAHWGAGTLTPSTNKEQLSQVGSGLVSPLGSNNEMVPLIPTPYQSKVRGSQLKQLHIRPRAS